MFSIRLQQLNEQPHFEAGEDWLPASGCGLQAALEG